METKTSRIHPLVAGAAISVMLVCLVGVAAITGIIPGAHSTATPAAVVSPSATTAAVSTPATETKVAAKEAEPAKRPVAKQTQAKASAPRTQVAQSTQAAVCSNCGRVESVDAIKQKGEASGVGVVGGAVVGGLLGNQIGGGNGKTLATVAGAVGGGYAGNEIEKHARSTTTYNVRVRMDDGSVRTFPYTSQPGFNAGDRVKVINGTLASQA
jgi:outer membrane lipoprotein SlyB